MKKIILLIIISVWSFTGFSKAGFYNSSVPNYFIQDEDSSNQVKIYPNPCKQEKVTIEFSSFEIAEVKISNIAGKEVLVKKFEFTQNKELLPLTDIPNGIYLLRIKTTDNKLVVKKLMIAKD